MIIKLSQLEKYGYCDPAGERGKLKRTRARQAIVVIGVDWLTRIFVLYTWAGRVQASRLRDRIIDTYKHWSPMRKFGIESNAMQELYGSLVRDYAKVELGDGVRIFGVPQSTKVDKDFRIRTEIEPIINEGRLFLLGDYKDGREIVHAQQMDCEAEMFGFPTAATKDIIDALASAIRMVPRKRRDVQDDEELKHLAAYLRRTGVASHLIEQRVAEYRAKINEGGDINAQRERIASTG